MNIVIRHEVASDFRETENVAREVVYNLYTLACEEHLLIHDELEKHEDYIS